MSQSEQQEYMRQHEKWNDKVHEIENKINQAQAKGLDWKSLYSTQLDHAKRQSALNYELATDRGF